MEYITLWVLIFTAWTPIWGGLPQMADVDISVYTTEEDCIKDKIRLQEVFILNEYECDQVTFRKVLQ